MAAPIVDINIATQLQLTDIAQNFISMTDIRPGTDTMPDSNLGIITITSSVATDQFFVNPTFADAVFIGSGSTGAYTFVGGFDYVVTGNGSNMLTVQLDLTSAPVGTLRGISTATGTTEPGDFGDIYLDQLTFLASAGGNRTITVTINDVSGTIGPAEAGTTIVSTLNFNKPPDAVNDSAITDEDTAVIVSVLANDSDVDMDTLSITAFAQGANGTVTDNLDGTLTYTPNADFNGADSFTYTISDGNGGTDTAAVSVTINAVNDDPVFNVGADQMVLEDAGAQTVSDFAMGSVGPTNESDQTLTYLVTTNNADLFDVQPSISSAGTLSYTPASNRNGTATITVIAIDDGRTANGGQDTSASQTFTITIEPVNDAPQFLLVGDQTVDEDAGPQSVTGFAIGSVGPANEADQTLSYAVMTDNPALFTVAPTINANGTLTYETAPDANGTVMITVTAMDNGGTANGGMDTSTDQTFMLTVNPVNDAPTDEDEILAVGEDGPAVSINLLDNAMDVDASDVLTIDGGLPTVTPGGMASVLLDGTFTFDPGTDFNSLRNGQTATVSYDYTVSDGNGGTVSSTVSVTINGLNDAPIAVDDMESVAEDAVVNIDVLANDSDPDTGVDPTLPPMMPMMPPVGDSLGVTMIEGMAVMAGDSVMLASGAIVTLLADGTFDYDTNNAFDSLRFGESAPDSFTYAIADNDGAASTATVSINVEGRGTSIPDNFRDTLTEFNSRPEFPGDSFARFGTDADDVIAGGTLADVIFGRDGDDRIVANNGDDTVLGDAGNDTLVGGGGRDVLLGGDGRDSVDGGAGNDILFGGAGDDTIQGRDGADEIDDGAGNDLVFAGGGDDQVFLAMGNDVINLGSGSDTVIAQSLGFGRDTINDFRQDQGDQLDLRLLGIDNAADAMAIGSQSGNFAVLDFGDGDMIRLRGININDLTDADFVSDALMMSSFSGGGTSIFLTDMELF